MKTFKKIFKVILKIIFEVFLYVLMAGILGELGIVLFIAVNILYSCAKKISIMKNKKKATKKSNKFKEYFYNLDEELQYDFLNSLDSESRRVFDDFMKDNGLYSDQMMQQILFQQFNDWAMEEGMKATIPFDMGGYVQGAGFNPSETMFQEMNNMNDMNNFNNFNDF